MNPDFLGQLFWQTLITAILLVFLAIYTAAINRGSRAGMHMAYWVFALAIWQFAQAGFYSSTTIEEGIKFSEAGHIGVVFIPVTVIHFVLVVTGHKLAKSPWVVLFWLVSVIFLLLFFVTDDFIADFAIFEWGYAPIYGSIGYAFIAWYMILITWVYVLLISAYKKSAHGSDAKKLYRGLLIINVLATPGSLDFLPTAGIDYQPMGWIFILFFSLGSIYLIRKYPFPDVSSSFTSNQILQSINSGVIITDRDKVVRLINNKIAQMTGTEIESILGNKLPNAFARDDFGTRIESMLSVNAQFSDDFTFQSGETKQEEIYKVSLSPVKDESGLPVGNLFVVHDVTESRRSRDELAIMRDRAIDASQAKSTFLASMSHELRTPLNAIIGYSEMIAEDFDELSKAEITSDLNRVITAARHLLSLINDILDLSKIEAGKMDVLIEEINLENMLHDISSTIRPLIEKQNNTLKVVNNLKKTVINADGMKLKQVLLNLLSNASKFTDNGKIELLLEPLKEFTLIKVKDSGIGMTEQEISRLFSEFTQANKMVSKEFGGTGLGLVLVKRFVELMGGEVTVESTPGVGTTFTLKLDI